MDTVTMKSLTKEYGEGIISMAMSYLLHVGKDALENADIEALVDAAFKQDHQKNLITPDVQERVLRCAKEMSKLEIEEILRYIKVDYRMFDVSVQEGRIIEFLTNATEEHILYVVVPSETTYEEITEAVTALNRVIEDYDGSHEGDFSEFDAKSAIYGALNQAKITPRELDVYQSVYI